MPEAVARWVEGRDPGPVRAVQRALLDAFSEDIEELEELFPRYRGLQRRISRLIRIAV